MTLLKKPIAPNHVPYEESIDGTTSPLPDDNDPVEFLGKAVFEQPVTD